MCGSLTLRNIRQIFHTSPMSSGKNLILNREIPNRVPLPDIYDEMCGN